MKRFYFLSIFFHGVLLLLLFTWETPLADRLSLRRIIEVSLVEKIEEKKLAKVRAPVPKQSQEEKDLEKKEVLQPIEKEEEKKGEKKEPASVNFTEEKTEKDEGGHWENKPLKGLTEQPLRAQAKGLPQIQEVGKREPLQPVANLKGRSTFFPDSAFEVGKERAGQGQGNKDSGQVVREPSNLQMSKIHGSSKEVDQTLLLIIRKIEAAKRYPKVARKMGIEGMAVVRFKLSPGGQVEAVEILESSGSEILDKASLETIREAAPLPYKGGWLRVGIVFKIL